MRPDGAPTQRGGFSLTDVGYLAGEAVRAQIWRTEAAGVPLLLLDTDVEGNSEGARRITDTLYGGDREHRLRQELVLGVGGPRALAALAIAPSVFHVNEGHAAFLALERLRPAVEDERPRDEALEAIRASTVSPRHAGGRNERFGFDLVRRYTERLAGEAGSRGRVQPPAARRATTASASRRWRCAPPPAQRRSVLHGEVAREMWDRARRRPIGAVTNGVHFAT